MRSNCERHPTLKGIHIIYDADGYAWRAVKRANCYMAYPSHAGVDSRTVSTQTRLCDLADLIGAMKKDA